MSGPEADAAKPRRRTHRRVTRPAPEGVDPTPSQHELNSAAAEDRPESWGEAVSEERAGGENEARLLRDRPPHWGTR